MKISCSLSLLCSILLATSGAFGSDLASPTHYSLRFQLFPGDQRVAAEARVTVRNNTDTVIADVPFIVHRLLEVESITDESGAVIRYSQSIERFADEPRWQVNAVKVELRKPLAPGTSCDLSIKYSGSICGYPEIMQYVQDRIDEDYSLLRPDGLAYPIIARPSYPSLRESYAPEYTFDIRGTVPAGYVVACGGMLTSSTSKDSIAIFTFESKGPVSRMDIAAARFTYLRDEASDLAVYCLPEDSTGGATILREMKRVIGLYTSLFGRTKNLKGYAGIEIPDGWGSQADKYSFLQTAAAFKKNKVSEVYHEIAHNWNAKVTPDVQRCRWFDEAFAMYFESLAMRAFQGDSAYRQHLDDLRTRWVGSATKERRNFDTPIAEYGKEDLGGNSYTKGAWSLYLLHELMGEEAFNQTIRALLSEYSEKPAGFKEFQSLAQRYARKDLTKFFDEWIYGAASSTLMAGKMTVQEMAGRY